MHTEETFSIPSGWMRNPVGLVTMWSTSITDEQSRTQARFTTMCNVTADTSKLVRSLRPQQSRGGEEYYCLNVDVILLFGLTELKAQISWDEMVRFIIISSRAQ